MLRRRYSAPLVIAVVALAALVLAILILGGAETTHRFGPVRIRSSAIGRPLLLVVAASLVLLALEWRSRAWRIGALTLLTASGVLAAIAAARSAPSFVAIADIGVEELYVLLATRGRLLVGPYSRFGWHHPGPLYFWLQAPMYAAAGTRASALYAGAWVLNVAWIALLAWILTREEQGVTAVTVAGAALWFAARTGGLLASPWTAHVPVLATLAWMAIVAGAAAGRVGLLPLLAGIATFVAQTHVGLVPIVVPLSMLASIAAVARYYRRNGRLPWAIVNGTAWLFALLWLLPIVEELSRPAGNLTALARFFSSAPLEHASLTSAVSYWAYGLAGMLRSHIALPWGQHFVLSGLEWAIPVSCVEVILLIVIGSWQLRRARTFSAMLAWTAAAASLIGLWSVTRIRADIVDHEIFWLTGLGAVNLGILAAAAIELLPVSRVKPAHAATISAVLAGLLVVLAIRLGARDFDHLVALERLHARDQDTMEAATDAVRRYVDETHAVRPLFVLEPEVWDWATGVFIELQKADRPFAVEPRWLPMFTDRYAPTGTEDAVIRFSAAPPSPSSASSQGVVVLEHPPVYVTAVRVSRAP